MGRKKRKTAARLFIKTPHNVFVARKAGGSRLQLCQRRFARFVLSSRILPWRASLFAEHKYRAVVAVRQNKVEVSFEIQPQQFACVLRSVHLAQIRLVRHHCAADFDRLRGVLQQDIQRSDSARRRHVKFLKVSLGKVLCTVVEEMRVYLQFGAQRFAEIYALADTVHQRNVQVVSREFQRYGREARAATYIAYTCSDGHCFATQHAVGKVFDPHVVAIGNGGEIVFGVFAQQVIAVVI